MRYYRKSLAQLENTMSIVSEVSNLNDRWNKTIIAYCSFGSGSLNLLVIQKKKEEILEFFFFEQTRDIRI